MIDDKEIRIIAAMANLDPRTVRRAVLDGERMRARADRRELARVLDERGHKAEAKKVTR